MLLAPPLPPSLFLSLGLRRLIPVPSRTARLHLSSQHRRRSAALLRRSVAVAVSACSTAEPQQLEEEQEQDQEQEQEQEQEQGFIEVGYISNVHGLRGELRVKPTTGFPELRFTEPGRRWLRSRVLGKESISEVELTGGRNHPGQKSWIISLDGIDTVEQAKQIIGSTLLVREEDRPELEDDEFYSLDLVGMKVVLKETGSIVGTVVDVFNTGASDLLQVMRNSAEVLDHPSSSRPKIDASGQVIWIPFVEAIVPDIDMDRREMQITPPKGLLELNIRSEERSKKERRQMEWKERKKLQQRLIAAKKKACELGQEHLLQGFSFGNKTQKRLLSHQILDINFDLFKHAMQNINTPGRYNFSEFMNANSAALLKNALKVSHRGFGSGQIDDINSDLYKEGHELLMNSKAAIIVLVENANAWEQHSEPDGVSYKIPEPKVLQYQELLLDSKRFLKIEEQGASIPIFFICPAVQVQSYEDFLSDNDYFHFDNKKVQVLEEEKLPIVSSYGDESGGKILLKSPWQVLQAPVGSGGLLSLLSSHNLLTELTEQGIDYVQVCSLSRKSAIGHPLFFGWVKSCGADVGIKVWEGYYEGDDEELDMIFSVPQLNRVCRQIDKIQFYAVGEQNAHVECVEKEWISVKNPDTPNSLRHQCSIYTCLKTCPLDRICMMHISE